MFPHTMAALACLATSDQVRSIVEMVVEWDVPVRLASTLRTLPLRLELPARRRGNASSQQSRNIIGTSLVVRSKQDLGDANLGIDILARAQ